MGAGFDIVSGGELQRVLAAGADPQKIVFSGVGKTAAEMKQALDAGILCFNIESPAELERLNEVAGHCGKRAPVSLRVNPNVDPKTHPYISTGLKEAKFGVAYDDALALYRRAAALPNIEVAGIDCHIGSQLLDPSPFVEALERILALVDQLTAEGIRIHHLDLGGGLGIKYKDDEVQPTVASYLNPLLDKLAGRGLKVVLEPGRRLVGNAGLLLTRVEFLKPGEGKNFAIVDAAMNDLMRPALYEAWHDILPVTPHAGETRVYDVVGPVCETGDFLGLARPLCLEAGDLLAVMSAGAYGMAMSFQLQHPAARGRGHGRWRQGIPDPPPRNRRRTLRRRTAVAGMRRLASCFSSPRCWSRPAAKNPPRRKAAPPTLITTTQAQTIALEVSERTLGSLEAVNDPKIGAEIAGKIVKIAVRAGEAVSKGQLLAQIDPTDAGHQANVDNAETRPPAGPARAAGTGTRSPDGTGAENLHLEKCPG